LLGPISTFKRPDETVIDEANSEDSPAQQTANSGGEDCPHPEAMANGSALGQRAREILVMRRKRYPIFGRAMFGEPAWDMLLLLYLSGATSAKMVSELAELAGASKSTGLRWVRYLEAQRLICRQSHATDKRAEVVTLSEKGVGAIEFYLHETLENRESH
jgi:DNA-binding MarR family transcriptional regulator